MTVTIYKGCKASGKTLSMLRELNEKKGSYLCFSFQEKRSMTSIFKDRFPNIKFVELNEYLHDRKWNDVGRFEHEVIGLDLAELRANEILITDYGFDMPMNQLKSTKVD